MSDPPSGDGITLVPIVAAADIGELLVMNDVAATADVEREAFLLPAVRADRQTGEREARDSHPSAHVLLASGDAWRAGEGIQELAGHQDLGTTQRYMHLSPAALDAAIRLLETGTEMPGAAVEK
jgi:hypothetical protein